MHAPQPSTALWTRSGALWRVLDRPLFETRVRELANALLELDRPPESVFALEHAATSEALTFAVAALEAGLTVRLGLAQPPLAFISLQVHRVPSAQLGEIALCRPYRRVALRLLLLPQ